MWKENYRIGIDLIDKQHEKLFQIVEDLIRAIETDQKKEAFQKTIRFLKDYVQVHFHAEEQYQESIGYQGLAKHRQQHGDFSRIVEEYEARLIQSDYGIAVVKELAGTLTAWLIYHVANEDQKIAGHGRELTGKGGSYLERFVASTVDVLEKMAGLEASGIQINQESAGLEKPEVAVHIALLGDLKGDVSFCFSQKFAFGLIEELMSLRPEETDELVCSALAELSNIASGNGTILLQQQGLACDIRPPAVLKGEEAAVPPEIVVLQTRLGKLGVALKIQ